MSQAKFDTAEHILYNKQEIFNTLCPEIQDTLSTESWWKQNGLEESFRQAVEDFVVYKIQWTLVDTTGKSFEEISEIVDKPFLVDLFGEEILSTDFWKGEIV